MNNEKNINKLKKDFADKSIDDILQTILSRFLSYNGEIKDLEVYDIFARMLFYILIQKSSNNHDFIQRSRNFLVYFNDLTKKIFDENDLWNGD